MKILKKWFKFLNKPSDDIFNLKSKYIENNKQPYIVRVENTSNESKDVVLFGALDNYEKTNSDGCIDNDGVFIDCTIPNTSYKDILWTSALIPFLVGYTQVYCKGGTLNSITTKDRDAYGNNLTLLLRPNETKNQVIKNILEFNQKFRVDGFTSINFTIPSKSTMIFYFFEKKYFLKK
jgi:hypothetical protein